MSTRSNDDPICDSTEGDKNALSCLQHRIRNLVAALGELHPVSLDTDLSNRKPI